MVGQWTDEGIASDHMSTDESSPDLGGDAGRGVFAEALELAVRELCDKKQITRGGLAEMMGTTIEALERALDGSVPLEFGPVERLYALFLKEMAPDTKEHGGFLLIWWSDVLERSKAGRHYRRHIIEHLQPLSILDRFKEEHRLMQLWVDDSDDS